jgi:transposase
MSTYAERYLAYADVRACGKVGDKAVLLVSKYGLSQKRASEALGVDRSLVRRALAAHSEGREIGRNGRPEALSVQEKEELTKSIEKMIEEHDSPTKRGVAEEVRSFFLPVTS